MAQDGGESKREFRNVFTIRVPSELDPDIATAAKTVDTVRINVAPVRFVPSALDRP
jgi:predicted HicB family RNase H-like nuclease